MTPQISAACDYRAFHVFLATSEMTTWLCAVAQPALLELEANMPHGRFFFVRHWEGGPHVRLRVSAARRVPAARWKHFRHKLHNGAERVEERQYVPESARYGGPEGIRIAEELFCRSSQVALGLFSSDWDVDRARAIALVCLLQVPSAFGWTRASFCRFAEWSALQAIMGTVPGSSEAASLALRVLEAGQVVAPQFASFSQFLGRRASGRGGIDPALIAWSKALNDANKALRTSMVEATLGSEIGQFGKRSVPFLWSLVWSYLHMHANRLGLTRFAEAEVASLAAALTRATIS